ncbi:hypothetical protein [Leifsonia sp. PS1209]|uniref:hypothetical protein n=1 Tax=Leifsonia sp. PS1209 TaxID=2724914 RepID=UPI001442DDD8|nr:hypothetical protein [Leifsonia sp. PS1209]QIZ98319.1 hypothetical protein HF024_07180 [Leifsonia sp. PS1209]
MHTTRTRSAAGTLGALVLVAAALSGCAPVVRSCPSWADFSDPDAAYRQADVVVVGHVAGRDGTIGTQFGDVRAYRFEVEDAVKGGESGTVVRIGSRADPCDGGDGYTGGDALAGAADRVIVYAINDTGGLVTLTPSQGVTALPDGAPLPFDR